jgi:hypothetical protein
VLAFFLPANLEQGVNCYITSTTQPPAQGPVGITWRHASVQPLVNLPQELEIIVVDTQYQGQEEEESDEEVEQAVSFTTGIFNVRHYWSFFC